MKKHFKMCPGIAELVREGEVFETDHFILVETSPNVFEWLEKEGFDPEIPDP